jgi:DNA-binding Xre family transcriptional regulator
VAKVKTRLQELVKERETKIGKPITQFEIAVQTGISLSTVSRWMRAKVNTADFETVEKLCEFLECDLGDLIYLDRSVS